MMTTRSVRAGPPHARIRVLVVDDHPILRKGLVDVFSHEPWLQVCGEAATAAEALGALANSTPDVAIVDLSLAGESGLDLVEKIATTYPSVRVLVLSGHDERFYADRALKAGALGYIMKDQGAVELLNAIRRVASGHSYVSADTAERIFSALSPARRAGAQSPFDRLSNREREVLALMGRGHATRDIAQRLQVSIKTVESHYAHLKEKLGAKNGRELTRIAILWSEDTPR